MPVIFKKIKARIGGHRGLFLGIYTSRRPGELPGSKLNILVTLAPTFIIPPEKNSSGSEQGGSWGWEPSVGIVEITH